MTKGCTYYPVCRECGESYASTYVAKKNPVCPSCKEIAKQKKDTNLAIKKLDKFEEAIYRIENMVRDFPAYKKAVETVRHNIQHKGWWQSTEEIMTAIELIKNGVQLIHQQKIGPYKVDFVLPEYKAILEIDGKIYHNDKFREGKRDGLILLAIGVDWHIVRIDTDRINKNISKLLPAVLALIDEQDRARKKIKI